MEARVDEAPAGQPAGTTSGAAPLLADARALLDVILSMSDGLVVQRPDGAIVLCNPAAERILGLSADELSGRTSLDPRWRSVRADGSPFPGSDHPAMVTLRTGQAQNGVLMGVHRPDGSLTWISVTSRPLADGSRAGVAGALTTFRDVTAERAALIQAQNREALLQATFDSLPVALCIADERDGRVLRVNAPLCALLQCAEREARLHAGELGMAELAEHLRGLAAEPAEFERLGQRAAAAAHGELIEDELTLRDGRVLRRATRGLVSADGAQRERLYLFEDVTRRVRSEEERRTLERRMQEVQRLESLGVLAGGIAHDFNNLLTTIVGNAEMAALGAGDGAPVKRQMERILEATARATALCQQMLSYAGSGSAAVRRLHLSDAVHETLRWLQPQLSSRVQVQTELAADLPAVLADPLQLNQVIVNLLANACEALGSAGGHVRVRTSAARLGPADFARAVFAPDLAPGEYVRLEVCDDGCGIEPAVLARVFDPFFSTKFSGSGLGLSAVLGIVRNHRGALTLESRVGAGTTVRVDLPVSNATPVVAP